MIFYSANFPARSATIRGAEPMKTSLLYKSCPCATQYLFLRRTNVSQFRQSPWMISNRDGFELGSALSLR